MWGISTLAIVALGLAFFPPRPTSAPTGYLRLHSVEDVVDARDYLIRQIFGDNPITVGSTRSRETVACEKAENFYCGMFDNVDTVETLTVTMEYGMTSLITIVTPIHPARIVTIYHHGHANFSEYNPGFVPSINALLSAGHTVAIISMPFLQPNVKPLITPRSTISTHDDLVKLPRTSPSSELKFFLQPVFQTVDEFSESHPDWQIQLAGLSGGGWTTVVAAAIDARINYSVSIAGSAPFSS